MMCYPQNKTGTPLSASFRIPKIWDSLNLPIFISNFLVQLSEKILPLPTLTSERITLRYKPENGPTNIHYNQQYKSIKSKFHT